MRWFTQNWILIAVTAAIVLGGILPKWGDTIQRMGNGNFMLVLSSVFFVAGLVYKYTIDAGRQFDTSAQTVLTAYVLCAAYVYSIASFNYAFSIPGAVIPVMGAILGSYSLWVAISEGFFHHRYPSALMWFFLCIGFLAIAGVAMSPTKDKWF